MKKTFTFYDWRFMVGYFLAWLLYVWALNGIVENALQMAIHFGVEGLLAGVAVWYYYEVKRLRRIQKDTITSIEAAITERDQVIRDAEGLLEKSMRLHRDAKSTLDYLMTLKKTPERPRADTLPKIAMARYLMAHGWGKTQACNAVPVQVRTLNDYARGGDFESLIGREITALENRGFEVFLDELPKVGRQGEQDLYNRFWVWCAR